MITIDDAIKKFKSRLELTDAESKDAIRKHTRVREVMAAAFAIKRDFLSGSYARWTKTKPLKDVDIFFVLDREKEGKYLKLKSSELLEAVKKVLVEEYGKDKVSVGRRSVQVTFTTKSDSDESEDVEVLSIDVVPAFDAEKGKTGYIIPDPATAAGWTGTDPEVHKEKATAANKAFDGEWKPMVKMVKKWNEFHGKPIKPSFLIEVMALDLLHPPFSSGYPYELKAFFATVTERIHDVWPDPAGLGPAVSDQMTKEQIGIAVKACKEAVKNIDQAIWLVNQSRTGDALRVWRDKIFGPRFPLS